ncbi:MAG TPA: AmmeMemoRadiSam system protein B [Vicinamibacterales bacterium]
MAARALRRAAVAGSWYPGSAAALTWEVDRYLAAVTEVLPSASVQAILVPHAGLVYSGPVAAWAYRSVEGGEFDAAVIIGPSHHVGFDGVAVYPSGAFDTPLGPAEIAADLATAIQHASPVVHADAASHAREHSLEMQLPFLRRVLPSTPIVPLMMGYQTAATIDGLAEALARALERRRVLLVASSDLSHYLDAGAAEVADRLVLDAVARFDADGLAALLHARPDHACGGGPILSVMRAARALGARAARVLRYADSGDVSGDKSAVVGYMAAALGTF